MPNNATRIASASTDVVAIAARAHERDRYLAALLSPREIRIDLIALAAFAGEVGRIPAFVTEPMMGRIRLQWWQDRFRERTSGGHPVAAAILDTINRHALPVDRLIGLIEAHEDSLDDCPFGDEAALLDYIDRIDGTLFELAARITGNAAPAELAFNGGRAYGLARLLTEMPATLAHGRLLFPSAHMRAAVNAKSDDIQVITRDFGGLARRHLAAIPRQMQQVSRRHRSAFLPLALVEPYLDALEHVRSQSMAAIEINPLHRVWRLWRCHRAGRV